MITRKVVGQIWYLACPALPFPGPLSRRPGSDPRACAGALPPGPAAAPSALLPLPPGAAPPSPDSGPESGGDAPEGTIRARGVWRLRTAVALATPTLGPLASRLQCRGRGDWPGPNGVERRAGLRAAASPGRASGGAARGAPPGMGLRGAGLSAHLRAAGRGRGRAGPPVLPAPIPPSPGPGFATWEPAPRGLAASLSWERQPRRHHEEVVLRWAPRPDWGGVCPGASPSHLSGGGRGGPSGSSRRGHCGAPGSRGRF